MSAVALIDYTIGELVHTLVVRRQLGQIFDHRSQVSAGRFPGGKQGRSEG